MVRSRHRCDGCFSSAIMAANANRSPTLVSPLLPVTDQHLKSRLEDLLNKSLSRHDGSHCNCLHGSSKYVVTEAYQVSNLPLWRRYQRFVRSMQDKHKQHGVSVEEINPSVVSEALTEFARELKVDLAGNERLLLHGTGDLKVAKAIATEGFDNRVRGQWPFSEGEPTSQPRPAIAPSMPLKMECRAEHLRRWWGPCSLPAWQSEILSYTEGRCNTLTRALPERSLFLYID